MTDKKMEMTKVDGTNGANPSSWDINTALRDLNDVAERAMLTPLLLGETARQIKEGGKDGLHRNLDVDHVEWGMHISNLTPEVKSLFRTWGFTPTDTGYEYNVGPVNVKITVFKKKWAFLRNPDFVYYGVDNFRVPNPFNKYWKARGLVR